MNNLTATTYPNGKFKSQSMCNETDGFRVQWYESGQMKSAGEYKHTKKDGLYTSWYENGQKSSEINYTKGIKDGQLTLWHKDGNKRSEVTYLNGRMNSLWVSWYKNGQIQKAVLFKDKKKVSKAIWYDNGKLKLQADYESDYRVRHELPEINWDSQPYKDFMDVPFTLDGKPEDIKINPYHSHILRTKRWHKNGVVKDEYAYYIYCSIDIGWYKTGQLKYNYGHDEGCMHWHENGQLSYEFDSSADKYTSFDSNGIKEYELEAKHIFEDDGFWKEKYTFFDEKDKKLCTVKQKDDESICYWLFYDSDDNKVHEYCYDYAKDSLTEDALWQFWIDQNIPELTKILTPTERHKSLFYSPIFCL